MVKRVINLFNDNLHTVVVLVAEVTKEDYPNNKQAYIDAELTMQEAVVELKSVEDIVQAVTNFPSLLPDVKYHYGRVYYGIDKKKKAIEEVETVGDNEFVRERGYQVQNPDYHKISFAQLEAV